MPQNIIDSNRQFAGEGKFITTNDVTDFMIVAILRKIGDKPFETPLDIPARNHART